MEKASYKGLLVWQKASELETQLLVCVKVGYLNETEIIGAKSLLTEIGKMLTSLINKLKTEN